MKLTEAKYVIKNEAKRESSKNPKSRFLCTIMGAHTWSMRTHASYASIKHKACAHIHTQKHSFKAATKQKFKYNLSCLSLSFLFVYYYVFCLNTSVVSVGL